MKRTNKKGFTIVELVIVIAVIAILAAVLIPTFSSVIDKAHASSAQQKARNALTIVLTETTDADGAVATAKYAFKSGDYWCTCDVANGQASTLTTPTKTQPAGTVTKNTTLSANADIAKLGVEVYTVTAAAG